VNAIRKIEAVIAELTSGGIDRREFLRRALAAGLGATTAGLLLDACGGSQDSGDPGGDRAGDGASGGADVPDVIEDRLAIYNWSDYVAEGTIPGFEEEFGVEVTYDTYESNEEMLAKLQAGAAGYDVVFPTGYIIEAMIAGGLLAPIRRELLTNWGNLSPIFLDPPFDPGNVHSVPYLWGMTGVAWRTDRQAATAWTMSRSAAAGFESLNSSRRPSRSCAVAASRSCDRNRRWLRSGRLQNWVSCRP